MTIPPAGSSESRRRTASIVRPTRTRSASRPGQQRVSSSRSSARDVAENDRLNASATVLRELLQLQRVGRLTPSQQAARSCWQSFAETRQANRHNNQNCFKPRSSGRGFFRFLPPRFTRTAVMNQRELNREVAKATGETISVIASLGFVPLTPLPHEPERDREPLVVDWDKVDAEREVLHPIC